MTTIALIPMKELSQAKARLAPVLDDDARRELALAMFLDVLEAALACTALDGVVVVTRDAEVLSLARERGAEGMAESGGLNEALSSAVEKLRARGVETVVVLAADLPLANSDAIAAVAQAEADVAVVPSQDGGTNALALPPGAIAFGFGPDSARRHQAAAEDAGLRTLRLDLPALAFDIDTPEDFARLRDIVERSEAVGQNARKLFETISQTAGTGAEGAG